MRMTAHYRAKLAAFRRIESSPNTIEWVDDAALHDAHCHVPFDATDSRSTGTTLGELLQVIRDRGEPMPRFGISPMLERRVFRERGITVICGGGWFVRSHEMPETGPFPWFQNLTQAKD